MEPTLKETRESNEGTRGEESSMQRKQHMQRPWGRDLCWRGDQGLCGAWEGLAFLSEGDLVAWEGFEQGRGVIWFSFPQLLCGDGPVQAEGRTHQLTTGREGQGSAVGVGLAKAASQGLAPRPPVCLSQEFPLSLSTRAGLVCLDR